MTLAHSSTASQEPLHLPASDPGAPSANDVARLVNRMGRLMLANGADTTHVLSRMDEVSAWLGHRVTRLVTTEALLVAVGDGAAMQTRIGPEIAAMSVDMGALVAIDRALATLQAAPADLASTHRELDAIERGVARHGGTLVALGVAVTAASLARLFDAAWPAVGVAFLLGLASIVMRRAFARVGLNPIGAAFLTALASGLLAEAAMWLVHGGSSTLCLVAAGMILVPGVPLLNGVRDLVSGHASNAVARLALGVATVLTIGFALFVAAAIAGEALPIDAGPGTLPVAADLLFSASAAAGFGILFNVPLRALPLCILCGMAGHGLRTALGGAGLGIAAASLVGAFAAGIVARLCARLYRVPPVVFAFPGVVALVPGSYGFRAGIGGLRLMAAGEAAPIALVAGTASLAVTAAIVTIAIAVGLLLALATPLERASSQPSPHP